MTSDLILKCCNIAKEYDGHIRIDGPDGDSKKFLVDIIDTDGASVDDGPSGRDEDLDEALRNFIENHEDDDLDPDSTEDEDGDED